MVRAYIKMNEKRIKYTPNYDKYFKIAPVRNHHGCQVFTAAPDMNGLMSQIWKRRDFLKFKML